ncbi:hypothetical protein VTN77DRAFT_8621 [Rasamsonia byssochlamydoides]|uniref:uncharacterized protein n=1 Tax=Rasamsonia byssochlamydoides TaxID=89139 RepID=UPI003742E38F
MFCVGSARPVLTYRPTLDDLESIPHRQSHTLRPTSRREHLSSTAISASLLVVARIQTSCIYFKPRRIP